MTLLADARAYIDARFGPAYRAWMALSDVDATRTLTSAASYLDSLVWVGMATGVPTGNLPLTSWPRSGIDGVDPLTVPTAVTNAAYELGVLILSDPDLVNTVDAGSNVASLGAGPAQISFFRPTSALDGTAPRIPPIIDRLIGRWLASASAGAGGFATGTNSHSDFCEPGSNGRRDVRWPL